MKKLVKLLAPSIAIMLVAIMSLTSASFAWFQGGNTANVTDLSADVKAVDGMLVSWDAKAWKSTLNFDDPEYKAITTNTDINAVNEETSEQVFEYAPVSTDGKVTSGALTMFTAGVTDGYLTSASTTSAGYVKFDLYVNLDSASTVWFDNVLVNGVGDGSTTQDTIGRAARIAIINQGNNSAYVVNDIVSLNGGTTAMIYEPNATAHTDEGINNQNTNIGLKPATSEGGEATPYINGDVFPYLGIGAAITTKTHMGTEGDALNPVTTITKNHGTEITNAADAEFKLDLPAGYSKLTFYVWVEGQDADCLNNLANTNLTVSFRLNKVTTTVEETTTAAETEAEEVA